MQLRASPPFSMSMSMFLPCSAEQELCTLLLIFYCCVWEYWTYDHQGTCQMDLHLESTSVLYTLSEHNHKIVLSNPVASLLLCAECSASAGRGGRQGETGKAARAGASAGGSHCDRGLHDVCCLTLMTSIVSGMLQDGNAMTNICYVREGDLLGDFISALDIAEGVALYSPAKRLFCVLRQ